MNRLEGLLMGGVGKICGEALRQHRANLAQGERAREVEEVAHGGDEEI
jgi:hypothetical protein